MTPAELRKITNEAIHEGKKRADEIAARESKAAARKLVEAQAKAARVIDAIPDRAMREAEAGRDHAIVMSIGFDDYDRKDNNWNILKPEWLKTACRLVWEHCVAANLKPTIERWDDGMGVNGGHNIVIHW